jgi:pantoate--beta-alanine ligase
MQSVKTVQDVRSQSKEWKKQGLSVGLVPTMGYLHAGHASLIRRARAENDRVVVSIFCNPMQFGPAEDLASYPRDLAHDSALCQELGADLIFHPEPSAMYDAAFCSFVDMNILPATLCGKSRPVHFRGVCTVVAKLLNIVQPDNAYFGQKDAQQLAIIRRMVADLNIDVAIHGCPIVREHDGLAMSSRNTYLSDEERQAALVLSQAVQLGQALFAQGETRAANLLEPMRKHIESQPLARIDYLQAVDGLTMQPISHVCAPALVAMAVYIGKTRLLDNFIIQ